MCLYIALMSGQEAPEHFNDSLMAFIPKDSDDPAADEITRPPQDVHPLALSDAAPKLVAATAGKN